MPICPCLTILPPYPYALPRHYIHCISMRSRHQWMTCVTLSHRVAAFVCQRATHWCHYIDTITIHTIIMSMLVMMTCLLTNSTVLSFIPLISIQHTTTILLLLLLLIIFIIFIILIIPIICPSKHHCNCLLLMQFPQPIGPSIHPANNMSTYTYTDHIIYIDSCDISSLYSTGLLH